jgi:hypothetical protein
MSEPPSSTPTDFDLLLGVAVQVGALAGVVAIGILLLAVSAPRGVKFVEAVVLAMLMVLCAAGGSCCRAHRRSLVPLLRERRCRHRS